VPLACSARAARGTTTSTSASALGRFVVDLLDRLRLRDLLPGHPPDQKASKKGCVSTQAAANRSRPARTCVLADPAHRAAQSGSATGRPAPPISRPARRKTQRNRSNEPELRFANTSTHRGNACQVATEFVGGGSLERLANGRSQFTQTCQQPDSVTAHPDTNERALHSTSSSPAFSKSEVKWAMAKCCHVNKMKVRRRTEQARMGVP
jgi:hypothetical protein